MNCAGTSVPAPPVGNSVSCRRSAGVSCSADDATQNTRGPTLGEASSRWAELPARPLRTRALSRYLNTVEETPERVAGFPRRCQDRRLSIWRLGRTFDEIPLGRRVRDIGLTVRGEEL